jgi:hypothetical protein
LKYKEAGFRLSKEELKELIEKDLKNYEEVGANISLPATAIGQAESGPFFQFQSGQTRSPSEPCQIRGRRRMV